MFSVKITFGQCLVMKCIPTTTNRYQDLSQSSESGGKVIEAMWVANIGMDWMALDVTTLQLTK